MPSHRNDARVALWGLMSDSVDVDTIYFGKPDSQHQVVAQTSGTSYSCIEMLIGSTHVELCCDFVGLTP